MPLPLPRTDEIYLHRLHCDTEIRPIEIDDAVQSIVPGTHAENTGSDTDSSVQTVTPGGTCVIIACADISASANTTNSPDNSEELTSVESDGDWDESETSSEDNSVFENLHNAVRRVIGQDWQLADRVVTHLCQLPPQVRALVYQFGEASSVSWNNPIQEPDQGGRSQHSGQPEKKRKRDSSSGRGQRKGGNNGDDKGSSVGNTSEPLEQKGRFACAFYIYDKHKYCQQNTKGRQASQYRTCAGPGSTEIKHYKEVA